MIDELVLDEAREKIVPVKLMRMEGYDDSILAPSYQTAGAAGADVRANFRADFVPQKIAIPPRETCLIPTGFRIAVADGYEIQVRPRSGLALKNNVTVLNSPGTIDCDYRGPLGIIIHNSGTEPFTVAHGDRIAQLIVAPVTRARFEIVDEFDETARGAGGYGSTGV